MTHRHMTEFTGLDFEMTIHEHYFEVLDMIEQLFTYMFDGLQKRWGTLLPFAETLVSILSAYPRLRWLMLSADCSQLGDAFTSTGVFCYTDWHHVAEIIFLKLLMFWQISLKS